jgi:hypothetical protein
MNKVAVLGFSSKSVELEELKIHFWSWQELWRVTPNLEDYEELIVLTTDECTCEYKALRKVLNSEVTEAILLHGGRITMVGDPRGRFETYLATRGSICSEGKDLPFLFWIGLIFHWDDATGDTILHTVPPSEWDPYVKRVRDWSYSLRHVEKSAVEYELLREANLKRHGLSMDLEVIPICANRKRQPFAFDLYLKTEPIDKNHTGTVYLDATRQVRIARASRFGPISFLPRVEATDEDNVALLLHLRFGVGDTGPEPNWTQSIVIPGEDSIREQLRQAREIVQTKESELSAGENELAKIRKPIGLLFRSDKQLEELVWCALRDLGADIQEPQKRGVDDGRLSISVGDSVLRAVLEVKSTRKETFDEKGLRQLMDWQSQALMETNAPHKGFFIGSNAIDKPADERPIAFADQWIKKAELSNIIAIKCEQLFNLWLADKKGQLDRVAFWKKIRESVGIFDSSGMIKD